MAHQIHKDKNAYNNMQAQIKEAVTKKVFHLVVDSIGVDKSFRDKILKLLGDARDRTFCVCVVLDYHVSLRSHINKLRSFD